MKKSDIILVDKRESEKFRKFTVAQFSTSIKKILEQNNSNYLWGIHNSQIKQKTWSQVTVGSEVFFSIPKNNFEIKGIISKKIHNEQLGKSLWTDELSSHKINYFLFFKNLTKIKKPFSELVSRSSIKTNIPLPGIYEINQISKKQDTQTVGSQIIKFVRPKESKIIPLKNRFEVNRFLRDSTIVKK